MLTWLIPVIVFAAVWAFARVLLEAERTVRLQRQALAVTSGPARPGVKRSPLRRALFAVLPRLGAFQVRWVPQPWGQRTEKRLSILTDWQGRSAAEWLATKELAALGGLLAGVLAGLDPLFVLALGAGAFLLPDLWLREKDQERRKRVLKELPAQLDLLGACMEAGLGFEPALGVLLERSGHSPLQAEFAETLRQIRMGLARRDALQAMARRVDEQEFTTFTTAVVHAERLGVSLATTLKVQSAQLRGKRSQRVEKLALEAPVKLLFPLIVFIFPVVFMVLFGPIVVRFMNGF
jgi:tight adherence protein C